MLFGSVPRPPKTPRSSTSTQSARQNTAAAMTAIRASRASERAALTQNAAPAAASAITATRFTANPWDCGEVAEAGDERLKRMRLRGRSPSTGSSPSASPAGRPPCPARIRARPGLEQRHAEEEDPAAGRG